MAKRKKQQPGDDAPENRPKTTNLVPAWKPGVSGNPAGRPPGARNRFSEQYVNDFHDVWRTHGKKAIQELAAKRPSDFVRIGAAILTKHGEYNQEHTDGFLEVLVALGRASRSRDIAARREITLEARSRAD